MEKEKTISQKLHEAARLLENLTDWFGNYEKWYKENTKNGEVTTDEGGSPLPPPPPPPHP